MLLPALLLVSLAASAQEPRPAPKVDLSGLNFDGGSPIDLHLPPVKPEDRDAWRELKPDRTFDDGKERWKKDRDLKRETLDRLGIGRVEIFGGKFDVDVGGRGDLLRLKGKF